MARYFSESDARADGFAIEHREDQHEFVLLRDGEVVGVAHYSLRGEDRGIIDFDHTEVDPSLRGTGLSGVLAQRALTDEIVRDRKIHASCWFIEGYLAKHPELSEGH